MVSSTTIRFERPAFVKAIRKTYGLLLIAIALAGCGGESDTPSVPTATPAASTVPTGQPAATEQKPVGPPPYQVLKIDNVKFAGSAVEITGTTDLPDNAKLTVDLDVADRPAKAKSISVSSEPTVRQGAFSAKLEIPKLPEFKSGKYEVEVLFTPMAQSDDILALVGKQGEKLEGSGVRKTDLGFNVMEVSQEVSQEVSPRVKGDTHPFVKSASYAAGTPEKVVAEYLEAWKAQDWAAMAKCASPAWRSREEDPAKTLANSFDLKRLLGATITGTKSNPLSSDVTFKVTYAIGPRVLTRSITARVLREKESGELAPDAAFGINPTSTLREN